MASDILPSIWRGASATTISMITGDEINRLSRVSAMLERSILSCPALASANSHVLAAIAALQPVSRGDVLAK